MLILINLRCVINLLYWLKQKCYAILILYQLYWRTFTEIHVIYIVIHDLTVSTYICVKLFSRRQSNKVKVVLPMHPNKKGHLAKGLTKYQPPQTTVSPTITNNLKIKILICVNLSFSLDWILKCQKKTVIPLSDTKWRPVKV